MSRKDRKNEPIPAARPVPDDGQGSAEEYSLEEIMNEFGGWSNRSAPEPLPEPEPERVPETQSAPETPEKPEPAAEPDAPAPSAEPEQEKPSRFRFINLDLNAEPHMPDETPEAQPEASKELWSWQSGSEASPDKPAAPAAQAEAEEADAPPPDRPPA